MSKELSVVQDSTNAAVALVIDGLDSVHSKRAYARALRDYMAWRQGPISKAQVNSYRQHLLDGGMGASSVNLRMSAIRKLAVEAADNGLLNDQIANGIARVKGLKQSGVRSGKWLTKAETEALLSAPDDTLGGKRDKALLGVLIGCGLRRSEAVGLTFDHIQQVEGRWAIVNMVGKRNRVRTVPMPSWSKALIDRWAEAAEIETGLVFRSVRKGGKVIGDAMTAQAIYYMIRKYADVAPHDLRRTFAKLSHRGGGQLDQIMLALGHASLKTTEAYLGVELNLADAPCDKMGLTVELE